MGSSSYLIPSSSIIPILITFYLLLPIAFPDQDDDAIARLCLPSSKKYTSDYSQCLVFVLIDLIWNTSSLDGLRNVSYSWPPQKPDERAYGQAVCFRGVSPDDCKACVNNSAIALVNNYCPENRSAVILQNDCFLKYSDVDFFGTIDTDNKLSKMSKESWNLSDDSRDAVKKFIIHLSQIAMRSPISHAQDKSNIKEGTLYGVVHCTRDLSPGDCKTCLESAVTNLNGSCKGEVLAYWGCIIRYETYNFLS